MKKQRAFGISMMNVSPSAARSRFLSRSVLSLLVAGWSLVFVASPLFSQEMAPERKQSPFSIGVLGGVSFNGYLGSIDIGANTLLGGGACGEVGNGTGSGAAFGFFAEYALSPSLSFGGRGLFEDRSGAMTADAPVSRYRLSNGEVQTVESIYRLELDLPSPSLELYAAFVPFSFPLRFTVGPKLGLTSSPAFLFAEELPENNELSFANGTKRAIYSSGNLDGALLFGLAGGVGYTLPMGGGLDLIPELSFSGYLNGAIPGESAPMVFGLRPSVAFRYRFAKPLPAPPEAPSQEPVPPPPPPPPTLSATILAHGISPDGDTQQKLLIRVDERIRRREIALLPYVFFDENSAKIPSRYLNRTSGKTGESIVDRYRDVLDLLGERMGEQPKGKVKLIGNNADVGSEKGAIALSTARAESVRDYLVERWKIDPSRIQVAARNLPENPSNNSWIGGQAENRRVEIEADGVLMAPLLVEDTVRSYSSPGLRIDSDIQFSVPFNYWEIRLAAGKRLIRSLKGEEIHKKQIDEKLNESELRTIADGETLSYEMNVKDESGNAFKTSSTSIGADVKYVFQQDVMLNDTIVEVSTPILFGYNSAELKKGDWDALMRLRNLLPVGSEVEITGYADSLGESGYNKTLSQRRADVVAKVFDNFPVTVIAAGERSDLVRDDTPESRFYARTVKVEVKRSEGIIQKSK